MKSEASSQKKPAFGGKSAPQKKRKKITERYLYNAGLYYLERFPASVAHFRVVMIRKIDRSMQDHPDQDRDQALAWLDDKVIKRFVELGYLNDRLYTRGVVTSLRRKGTSRQKILMTLKHKGVERALTEEILAEIDADMRHESVLADEGEFSTQYQAELEAALRFCRKKRMQANDYQDSSLDAEAQQKLRNKYLGRLARQGFAYDVAVKALEHADTPQ